MAQPTTYNRQASFTNIQAQAPSDPLPGDTLDVELNAIKATLDGILENLELIQRDDGELANESVGLDQLSEEIEVGWEAPETWVTATDYVVGNTVFHGSAFYRCLTAHTAGVFATDLAASKWELIVDLSTIPLVDATQIAFTPTGGIAASTVAGALAELDSEKAASSHTHPASAISDSTAAGRTLLTAATAAAQRTALGLGSIATQDTAFSPAIEPLALGTDTNNWAPTGVETADVIRMSSSAAINLTGLLASSIDGGIKILENVGTTYAITLLPSSTSSSAANRFLIHKPIVVGPNECVMLKYDLDGSLPGWRQISAAGASTIAGGYRNLKIVNGGTPNNQMAITADAITLEDSAGRVYRATSVSVTPDITASGANGLDTGTVANSTWYSEWVIYNPTTNVVAGLLSTSASSPTLPSGYTFKTRVGWTRTDGSAHLLRTVQYGSQVRFTSPALSTIANGTAGNVTTPTWVSLSTSNYAPSTAVAIVIGTTNLNGTGAVILAPNNSYSGISSTTNFPPFASFGGGLLATVFFETAATVYWAGSATNGALYAAGWIDSI